MSNLNDLLRDTPSIPSRARGGQNLDMLVVRSIIQTFTDFLRKELPGMELSVQSKDAMGLQRDVMALTRSMESLSRVVEQKENTSSELKGCVDELKAVISDFKFPEQKDFPTSLDVRLNKEDIQAIRSDVLIPPMPDEMRVSNIGQIVDALDSLGDLIRSLKAPDSVKVSNLKDIKFPKAEMTLDGEVKKAIMRLNLIGKDPKDAISVRLADGDEFYRAVGESVGGAVALGPIPGNSVRSGGASFTLTMDGTAKRITTSETKVSRIEVTGNDMFVWGYDSSINHSSGSERGCIHLPSGLPCVINIDDLSKVYFKGASGVIVCGNYLY